MSGGTIESSGRSDAIAKLKQMGLVPIQLIENGGGPVRKLAFLDSILRVNSDHLIMFYLEFASMIKSGLPMLTSLSTLKEQSENARLKSAISDIGSRIESGSSLSQSLAAHPDIFSNIFTDMVKAGEASGKLDTVLTHYAGYFESQEDLRKKIMGAIYYPLILLFAGAAVVLLIISFVIPKFAEIYGKAGVPLPVLTQVVYNIGTAIKRFWYMIPVILALILLLIREVARTDKGSLIIDALKLKLPLIGPLYRRVILSRFARTLATLLGSGVPILESLDICRDVVANRIFMDEIAWAKKYVEKGERLSEPLKASANFPPDIVQMISVGEETGNVEEMLNNISDLYDTRVTYAVKKLTTLIEPIFLVVMGAMVGVIMASMLLPIFDMIKTIKR